VWTAEHIFPDLRDAYTELRRTLRKREPPLNVIVSATGRLDLRAPVFQSGLAPALVVTTRAGAAALRPAGVDIAAPRTGGRLSARAVLSEALKRRPGRIVLVEGGPQLLGDFYAERCLDQQFLTLAPQIAGRDREHDRPSLVMGKTFAPRRPLWGELLGVKRGAHHLFLRYQFHA
jgi:riboflavin biosynthesis pyrimidine reductase